jgi:hypothetical protein
MSAVASVHLADVGAGRALRLLGKAPKPGDVPGLRHADIAVTGPLSAKRRRPPTLGRTGLVAFWDDDDALERFLADHPVAAALAGGWHARLEPLRSFGTWPGLDEDLPHERATPYDGPAIVLTLGRLRLPRTIRFLRTSGQAERSAVSSPGFVWGTAMAKPPFVATCSVWESTRALATYAYGHRDPGHPNAIAADAAKPFHHQSAFVRFRPYAMAGSLGGRNPLPAQAISV